MPLLTEPNTPLKREDLGDEFTIVDAKITPVSTMIRKGPAPENTLFEYPVDDYDAPALGGRVDGTDVGAGELGNGLTNAAKLAGRTQWFLKAVGVGKIANTVPNVAGVGKGKAYAYSIKKKLVELKRNIEYTFLSIQDSRADNGTLAGLTRGIGSWINTAAQTDQPVPAAYRPVAGQQLAIASPAALTEDQIQALLQAIWSVTGSKDTLWVPCVAGIQRAVTNFTNTQTQSAALLPLRRFTHAQSGTIEMHVDRYVGDFGTAMFVPVQFMDATNALNQHAYFMHIDRWHTRTQQAPQNQDLPDGGGGKKGMLDAILGLACLNPKAEAKIIT